jgi:ATP phosphoribosyltransferase regulatory subunit
MDTSDPDLLPEGLEDRLPRAAATATRVMRTIHGVMEGHGYDRVLPPMIEFERSLASRMAGISSRRMFRFVDPQSLRMMALRSDITPQIGRIAGTRLAARRVRCAVLCGAGRHHQGRRARSGARKAAMRRRTDRRDNVAAAAEVVAVAIEALQAAGAGVSVDFTLPDLVDTLAERACRWRRARSTRCAANSIPRMPAAWSRRAGRPMSRCSMPPAISPRRSTSWRRSMRAARWRAVSPPARDCARLGGRARLTLDPAERHGFEYQSWFGFVLYAEGVRGALGRGGTYRIAVPDGMEHGEVATGFSLYPDALIDLRRAASRGRQAVPAARPRSRRRRAPARDRLAHRGRTERGGRGCNARLHPRAGCRWPRGALSGALSA